MAQVIPGDFKDGDALEPWHVNFIFRFIRRWMKFDASAPLNLDLSGASPPHLSLLSLDDLVPIYLGPGISSGSYTSPASASCDLLIEDSDGPGFTLEWRRYRHGLQLLRDIDRQRQICLGEVARPLSLYRGRRLLMSKVCRSCCAATPTLSPLYDQGYCQWQIVSQTVSLSGISAGTGGSAPITVTASSSNTSLVPNPTVTYTSPNASGSLVFTVVRGGYGTALITVTVTNAGGGTFSRTFTVTVTIAMPQPPTLDQPSDFSFANLHDGGVLNPTSTFSGVGYGGNTTATSMTVTAVSSNPGLVSNPTVTYTSPNATGTLTYTAPISGTGVVTITVTVTTNETIGGAGTNACGSNTFSQTFTVTVT